MTGERATVRLLAKRPNKPIKLTVAGGARSLSAWR